VGDEPLDEDPGWPTLGMILLGLVPGMGIRLATRTGRNDPLVALRAVFLSFSSALVLFGVVLAFLDVPNGPVLPWLAYVIVSAAASVVAVQVTVKPLDCSSAATLATSYRQRFFLVIAFSESVALFAFVFTFIGGPRWIYDVGGVFALYRFWTVFPPTRAGLAHDQERVTAAGCELSLVRALRSSPPPGRG
jgi:F0F1-type ATP synthase membrane subunit c/vacuolar-type H+-ATPase subunit K